MTAKSKIFRYFPQRRCATIAFQIVPDHGQRAFLVDSQIEIVHTYKCTYFVEGLQVLNFGAATGKLPHCLRALRRRLILSRHPGESRDPASFLT